MQMKVVISSWARVNSIYDYFNDAKSAALNLECKTSVTCLYIQIKMIK